MSIFKEIDYKAYSKNFEVIQLNILICKLITDSFSDEELTGSQSIILYHLINIIQKIYLCGDISQPKIKELIDKLLGLTKTIFCRKISWLESLKKMDSKKGFVDLFLGNIADLVNVVLKNLQKHENNLKEYKSRWGTFKTIISHLGPLTINRPKLLKTLEGKFLVPILIDYLMDCHEKFSNFDEEGMLPILFEALFMALMAVADNKIERYNGDEAIIPNYDKFLERLVVLTLDTKDEQNKERYKAVLKTLCRKTPFNFMELWEKSVNNQSLARIDLFFSMKEEFLK